MTIRSAVAKSLVRMATKVSGGDPQNPQFWVQRMFGGGTSTISGVEVNEDTALTLSAVWAAVHIISRAVGYLPLNVFERMDRDEKERRSDHPVHRLLHDRANPFMDSLTFRETLQAHVLLWGNGYAEIQRNGAGQPGALWPVAPFRVKPENINDELWYNVDNGTLVPAINMIHIKGLGFSGMSGYSVISYAGESIGAGLATEQYGARFFGNNAVPRGVLEYPGKFKDPDTRNEFRKQWADAHEGDNQHKTAVLENGMKYTPISIPPEDSQLIETRKVNVAEIARWFQVPLHMLSEMSNSTFSNIEHQGMEFVTQTLMPWLRKWELETTAKLLTPPDLFAEFNTAAFLRGDTKTRFESYGLGIRDGWFSRNEARKAENLPRVEGLDDFLLPMNMGDGGDDTDDDAGDGASPMMDDEDNDEGE